jgi:GGDEF domain-containing protein
MERLWELYRDLGTSLDLDETLSALDRHLARLLAYDAIAVHLEEDTALKCVYVAGAEFAQLAESPPGVAAPGLPATLTVPLHCGGKRIGALSVYRTGPVEFAGEDRAALQALSPKLSACIENALRFRRATAANQRALFERLDAEVARIRRSHGRLVVLECAVPGLDPCGARAERVAAALRRACREYDFITRSGDGFLIVLADFAPTVLDEVKTRIQKVLHEAGLRGRIGAAHFPVDGYDAEDLLAAAHGAAHA